MTSVGGSARSAGVGRGIAASVCVCTWRHAPSRRVKAEPCDRGKRECQSMPILTDKSLHRTVAALIFGGRIEFPLVRWRVAQQISTASPYRTRHCQAPHGPAKRRADFRSVDALAGGPLGPAAQAHQGAASPAGRGRRGRQAGQKQTLGSICERGFTTSAVHAFARARTRIT